MIDGAEEYRVAPGSRRNAGDQTNIFPVDGSRRSESSRDEFMLKIASRWQSVNQWKSTTTATSSKIADQRNRTHLREIILLASRSKHRSQALHGSSLA